MKIRILLLSMILLIVGTHAVKSQDSIINNEESTLILSEATITSIANLLYKYKKEKQLSNTELVGVSAKSISLIENDNTLELALMQKEIEALKNVINNQNTASSNIEDYQKSTKRQIVSDNITSTLYENDRSAEILVLQKEIEALKYKIEYNKITAQYKGYDQDAYAFGLKRDLNNLEIEMAELRRKSNYNTKKPDNTAVIVSNTGTKKNEVPQELTLLQKQLDSLFAMSAIRTETVKDSTDLSNEYIALQLKLNELQNALSDKTSNTSNYTILKEKYKNFERQIYFANNSDVLNKESQEIVQELQIIFDSNENIDFLLKGFASDKGRPSVNDKLSMERTEAVKKALVLNGVHPSRILTEYFGIDYQSTNEKDARRVDISLVIRR